MDGSHFDTRYPVVLRFEGFGPESLAGYEKHRKRIGGDVGHILKNPPTENHLLIGSEDWVTKALAEIAEIQAENFAAELEALEKRNRKKDIRQRMAEGPYNPWRPTRHGPMREVILTANKQWFDADPAAVFDEGIDNSSAAPNVAAVRCILPATRPDRPAIPRPCDTISCERRCHGTHP